MLRLGLAWAPPTTLRAAGLGAFLEPVSGPGLVFSTETGPFPSLLGFCLSPLFPSYNGLPLIPLGYQRGLAVDFPGGLPSMD